MKKKERVKNPVQPISGTKVPRFAGPSTFARLPEMRDVKSCDVAIVGIPFDAGTSYRPGARFGPQSIRQASRHLRTNYHPSYDIDVLDPAHAPGTGTPEIAGMTTREMVNVLRGLAGVNLISADVVEVSPAYDHAELTSLAAATIVYELTNLFARNSS